MIRFIKEPPGKFRPQFKEGGTARFDKARERILIEKGFAVEISEEADKGKSGRLQPDNIKPGGSEALPIVNDGSNGSGQHHHKSNPRKRSRD